MRACIALACVVGISASACANDFDALFASGADGGADAGSEDASAGPAGDPSMTCGPRAASCGDANRGCTNGTCSHVCSGCGCMCPRFDCPTSGDNDRCTSECQAGSRCDVQCEVDECELAAHGANARFVCRDDATCNVTCDQGALCEVRCDNEGPCTVQCSAGAGCLLRCNDAPSSCDLFCEGTLRTCPGGVRTCNRECPS